jgi:hypothetical protein
MTEKTMPRQGPRRHRTEPDHPLLVRLRRAAADLRDARAIEAFMESQRDARVADALDAGIHYNDVAEAAGVTRWTGRRWWANR